MNKTWGAMKSAGAQIKSTTQQAASIATTQVKSKVGIKEPYKKLEKRISEEIHKIFDDTDSFYYSPDCDITNNLQRKESDKRDDRFFWNKHMVSEILKLDDQYWTLPIIQGFVQVEQCVIENECFTLGSYRGDHAIVLEHATSAEESTKRVIAPTMLKPSRFYRYANIK